MNVRFEALEYRPDGGFQRAAMVCDGSPEHGWQIHRNDRPHLELGPGYRLLRTVLCGVCSTDLDRRFLPFPLPQITGHELVATDEDGHHVVVEINASHHARRIETSCAFCNSGLPTHCPERIVLGIHDLPGGFGAHVLAPVDAVLPVPAGLPLDTAVLIEPFAAALHAVTRIAPRQGETIAVLGPRRLGMLVIAALRAWSDRQGLGLEILALARRPDLLEVARQVGATATHQVQGDGAALSSGLADVVIDTTGNPDALELAGRLARREVHLKSTHGRPSAGLAHTTAMVVDELGLAGFRPDALDMEGSLGWLAGAAVPASLADRVRRAASPLALRDELEATAAPGELPRVAAVVAGSPAQIDAAVRPDPTREQTLVRPRGEILLLPDGDFADAPLLAAIAAGRLRLSTSRCGDFATALALMAGDPRLRGLGQILVTHRFPADALDRAFRTAASAPCLKAVVEHPTPPQDNP